MLCLSKHMMGSQRVHGSHWVLNFLFFHFVKSDSPFTHRVHWAPSLRLDPLSRTYLKDLEALTFLMVLDFRLTNHKSLKWEGYLLHETSILYFTKEKVFTNRRVVSSSEIDVLLCRSLIVLIGFVYQYHKTVLFIHRKSLKLVSFKM